MAETEEHKALVVEDESEIIKMMGRFLAPLGLTTYSANNVHAAIQMVLRNLDAKVLIVDRNLGDENTENFLRNMDELCKDNGIAIIGFASGGEFEQLAMMAAGCDDFVAKPDFGKLVESVKHHITPCNSDQDHGP